MRVFGLIGYPLSHSFSGAYFAEKFKCEGIGDAKYTIYPISNIALLPKLIEENPDLAGLNVTIPYKEQIIPYLDSTDKSITEIGAVNTVVIRRNGGKIHLKGFNTDVYGFEVSLEPVLSESTGGNALVLGTGGASRAVAWVLKNKGFGVTFVSRRPAKPGHISYEMLTRRIMETSKLIVNTSPAGMYPDTDKYPPIPYEYITKDHVLYDLIYNPEETLFMKKGKDRGATIKNGLQMLHLQAEKSWDIWNSDDV